MGGCARAQSTLEGGDVVVDMKYAWGGVESVEGECEGDEGVVVVIEM
jgi:hypothetical protein